MCVMHLVVMVGSRWIPMYTFRVMDTTREGYILPIDVGHHCSGQIDESYYASSKAPALGSVYVNPLNTHPTCVRVTAVYAMCLLQRCVAAFLSLGL